ncbi:phosphopantetheine-binding protein [Streptomyces sp. BE308]|uniref:phosphopantetheine-binding protein n=1 Tax=unclassified Streptomyces TaxID=2593676 RepID=UPI002E76807E|nr:phosphopantetheine-binding protein [Streptomyces sp. BE308]MEE1792633.1 phosphopantetheine-binding protein [Streptomyces sp. BE308]
MSVIEKDRFSRPELVEHITGVWEDVLGLDRVESDQDFFELGGHSLGAVRAASRIGDEAGCDLPLRAIFEHRTVDALAAAMLKIGAAG